MTKTESIQSTEVTKNKMMPYAHALAAIRAHKTTQSRLEFSIVRSEPGFAGSGFGLSTYRGGYSCGPGWGFTSEDIRLSRVTSESRDAIDQACQRHDQCYATYGYFSTACDKQLISELRQIINNPSSSSQQMEDAAIMAGYFEIQMALSNGVHLVSEYGHRYGHRAAEQFSEIQDAVSNQLNEVKVGVQKFVNNTAQAIREFDRPAPPPRGRTRSIYDHLDLKFRLGDTMENAIMDILRTPHYRIRL